MSEIVLCPYQASMMAEWDEFVVTTPVATFLHSRRFLSYHGDRFRDLSLVWRDGGDGPIVAVLPAAKHREDPALVVSHPGATFGGLLFDRAIWGKQTLNLLQQSCRYYADLGYRQFAYKPVPAIYHRLPAEEDLWALFLLDAKLARRGLSAALRLDNRVPPSERRRRSLRKSIRADCAIAEGGDDLAEIWDIITHYLYERHGVTPAHNLEEMEQLLALFPHDIEIYSARLKERTVGGIVMFHSQEVAHVQYSVASDDGAQIGAMDLLIEHAIERAKARGARYVDFGISTDHTGLTLNEGLHRFKLEFGAGTSVYDLYMIDIISASTFDGEISS